MWSDVIVSVPPPIKLFLEAIKVAKHEVIEYLKLEGSIEAFVFALGLRMIRPAMDCFDSQLH